MIVQRIPIQKEFGNKANKLAKRKYYLEGGKPIGAAGTLGVTSSILDIAKDVQRKTENTAKKTGRTVKEIQKKVFEKQNLKDAGKVRFARRSTRQFDEVFNRDKLADKLTEEGKKKYQEKLKDRAAELKKAKKAKLSQESIAHHQEVIDALKAKAKNIKNAKIALGVGAAGLATLGGVAAYKHYKKNKEKEDK
jgi:hypothetical protein